MVIHALLGVEGCPFWVFPSLPCEMISVGVICFQLALEKFTLWQAEAWFCQGKGLNLSGSLGGPQAPPESGSGFSPRKEPMRHCMALGVSADV